MLTEFLRSFTLPGLEKKYIVADDSLTEEGAAADSKKVGQELAKKVDKETGKALSTNDYTNAEKTKLEGIDSGAQVNTIEGVKVDGTEVTPDAQKKVNLNVYDKAAIDAIVQEIYAEVAKKLNIDGYSEAATVGNALGLVTNSVVEDKEPYNFRSLAHLPVGKFCYDTIVGGSVVWNQLAKNNVADTTMNGITYTNNGDGSYTLNGTTTTSGSYVYVTDAVAYNHVFFVRPVTESPDVKMWKAGFNASFTNNSGAIHKFAGSSNGYCLVVQSGTTVENVKVYPQCIDLTAALPPTIADHIYSLEQTTAGAGVAWFRKYFPGIYYGYSEPHFEYVQTSAKCTVGFNQFDVVGSNVAQGDFNNPMAVNNVHTDNLVEVLGNTTYYYRQNTAIHGVYIRGYDDHGNNTFGTIATKYNDATKGFTFTTPEGCRYIKILWYRNTGLTPTVVRDDEVCLNIHGDRDGEYEPYRKRIYPIEPKVLRGVMKLDSANRPYFDGDVMRSNGSGEQRYGLVDMGTLTWIFIETYSCFYAVIASASASPDAPKFEFSAQCTKYPFVGTYANLEDKTCAYIFSNRIAVRDTSYTDAESFKTAMSGVYLLYELATPQPFTAEPFQSPMVVDPLGTEEFVDYAVEQGDRDVKIPCGHTSEYPEDLVDKLEVLPHATGTNGDFLITEIDGKLYLKPYTQTVGLTSVSETEAE